MRHTLLAATACALLAGAPPAPPDLDVGVPPGSPTGWGRQIPAITPRRGPMFPITSRPERRDPSRTESRPVDRDLELRIGDSFAIVRILTWDLAGHLDWITGLGRPPERATGAAANEPEDAGPALYWLSVAALLRLLLHPQQVSEAETIAHLVELGEPVLGVLESARAEEALLPACREIEARVAVARRAFAPLPGRTPRETMLQRFVAEELVAAHPYDPQGGFGRRLFLFADEVEPLVAGYTRHADPFLRRNATAALGRYETAAAGAALLALGAEPADAVVQMRALAALGGSRPVADPAVLVHRLQASTERFERVALIQALGRLRHPAAVPALLAIGNSPSAHPDTLLAVLMALVAILHTPATAPGAESLAHWVAREARRNPTRFRAAREHDGPAADVPDRAGMRGEILLQLALLLRARVRPGDGAAAAEVVGLGSDGPGPKAPSRRPGFSNDSLGNLHPPVQVLFLETLGTLGPAGAPLLLRIADDPTVEPSLRGYVLGLLPAAERGELARRLLDAPGAPDELRISALEVLAGTGHPDLAACARRLLEAARGALGTAARRQLWLTALRALEARGLLRADDLLPLLPRVDPPGAAAGIADPKAIRVRTLVLRLVADAAGGMTLAAMRARIEEILDLMVEEEVNDRITAATRKEALESVGKLLLSLRGHRSDAAFQEQVVTAILQYLLGFTMPLLTADPIAFAPVVQFEAEVLLALGRTHADAAAPALAQFLTDGEDSQYRAHACLAVGMLGRADLARHLPRYLLDEDGFVRLCAYESLRHLTGQDFFADWLHGEPSERVAVAERWFRWCSRGR